MVRPRFAKLPAHQQQRIVQAALDEFAAHGFHDASLNRIIDDAGISKGSLYYYFDDKGDLFAYVVRSGLGGLLGEVGQLPELDAGDADTFWSVIEDYYLRLTRTLLTSPQLAALLRGWSSAAKSPEFQRATGELEEASVPWIAHALAAGRRVGAVREDLPESLLIAVTLGMGEAMDTWLLARQPDDGELPEVIAAIVGMLRRAVAP